MTNIKMDARSYVGETFAADVKSGAVTFDKEKGAFFKPSTQQEYLRTNQDRLVRWDGAVGTLNAYEPSIKNFCPINALQDGEKLDRSRSLKHTDLLAKPTWTQMAGEASLVVAQGAVAGVALGTIGGAIYGVATHRGYLSRSNGSTNNSANGTVGNSNGNPPGIGVSHHALHAAGPFHPGDLRGPDPININAPPPAGLTPGQAAQEQAAQGAFAAGGAIIGAAVGGPVGAFVGGIIGAGVGAAWNEAVR